MTLEESYQIQDKAVIEMLVRYNNMDRCLASKTWYGSKTYKFIHEHNLDYMSETRCYDELLKEMTRTMNIIG